MGKRYFISLAGGGIRFIGILVAFICLLTFGVVPSFLSGVSAGAIVAFLHYSKKLNTGLLIARETWNPSIIFSKRNNPMKTFKGIPVWQICKLLRKRNHLGKMDNLEKNLREIVTSDHWDEIQKLTDNIDCYIHCCNYETMEKISFNLKDLTYEQAIDVVIGSATIIPFVPPRKTTINGETIYLIDGGFTDSSSGAHLIENEIVDSSKFDELLTVWSRSGIEEYSVTKPTNKGNILDTTQKAIDIVLRSNAIKVEKLEREYCEERGKKYSPLHLDISTSGVYSITKELIQAAEARAKLVVDEYIKNVN